jgi:hypothetical protein
MSTVCGFCNKADVPLKCGRCQIVFYCDTECQRSDHPEHQRLCKIVGRRRDAAAVDMRSWPIEFMRPGPDDLPPLYPGRPAWVDNVAEFLERNKARLAPFKRVFKKIRASELMTLEEYCRQCVALQVVMDERYELTRLWTEVYGAENRVTLGKHLLLYRLAGFRLDTVDPDGKRALFEISSGKTALEAGELMTHAEFTKKYFAPEPSGGPPLFGLMPKIPYAGRPVPRVCDACGKPAACRCSCNEAYCSRACQISHWASHRFFHVDMQQKNEHLFTLTKVYWAEQFEDAI